VKDFGKPVRDKLSQAGCAFHRRGKGDHDIRITEEEQIAFGSTRPIVAALGERGDAVQGRPEGRPSIDGLWTASCLMLFPSDPAGLVAAGLSPTQAGGERGWVVTAPIRKD
jgi:hypothetical protein